MVKRAVAVACLLVLSLCGCSVPRLKVVVDDPAEAEAEPTELALDDEAEATDEALPVNPSGKTEFLFSPVGTPYELGPVEFNCPSSFGVMERTDDSITLYEPYGPMVQVVVDYDSHMFNTISKLTDDQVSGVVNGGAPGMAETELRWIGRYDDYATYSSRLLDDDGNVSLNTEIYSSDGWEAKLLVTAEQDLFDENRSEIEDIADSLRPIE